MSQRPGRPRGRESDRRAGELLRLIASGETLKDAARQAHVKPERVLTLLGQDEFFAAYQAVRVRAVGPVAALVVLDEIPAAA